MDWMPLRDDDVRVDLAWAGIVDTEHLARIRAEPDVFAAGGTAHLILEVLAYAAEEAQSTGGPGR